MIKLYHATRTRSFRIVWLLEELGIPYELEKMAFVPPQTPFAQASPFGKFPAIEDGELSMFESGAILEYVIERYGNGRSRRHRAHRCAGRISSGSTSPRRPRSHRSARWFATRSSSPRPSGSPPWWPTLAGAHR